MRVFVLARTESEVTREIYPALAGSSGITVAGYATGPDATTITENENLAAQLAASQADSILVRVTISRRGEEQALLEQLATHGLPLFVALPRGRQTLAAALEALPGVAAVGVEPLDYAALVRLIERGDRDRDEDGDRDRDRDGDRSLVGQPPATGDEGISVAQASPSPAVSAGVGGITSNSTQGATSIQAQATPAPQPCSLSPSLSPSPRLLVFTSGLVGGTGKSTLAGSLAWLLADPTHGGNLRVALLAFDSPPAIVSHFSQLSRWPHVGLFLQQEGEGPFEIERVMQRLPDVNLSVLAAPGDLALYDEIGERLPDAPGSVMHVVEAALAQPGPGLEFDYDVVIADLPPNLSGWAVHPLRAAVAAGAGDILLVARPSVAGQAGVVSAMNLLYSLGQRQPPRLILNDYHQGLDISPGDFVAGLRQLLATACYDPIVTVPHCAAVRAAQNEGLPLALAEGTDSVLDALCKLARALGFEIREARFERREMEIETRDRDRDRDGGVPGKRRALTLPGVRIKLTD